MEQSMRITKNKAIYISGIILIGILAAVSLTKRQYATVKSGTHILMDTTVRVTAVAVSEKDGQTAIKQAITAITNTEKLMSYYDAQSQLSALNKDGYKNPVKVSDELFYVISKSVEFNKLTDGAFDCTIAPVLDLWRAAAKTGIKPTAEQLAAAKAKTGCGKLVIDAQSKTIKFSVDGMKIDLGGIAKGYAVDKAIEAMMAAGAVGGLVDAGGDIRCFGIPPAGQNNWIIGLQNPETADPDGQDIVMKFAIDDMAITTSGDYYRFVVIDGEKISHIIDPKKSTSAKELCSVSVIAPDATTADALSTGVTVLGKDKGKELIEALPGIEALLITSPPQEQIIKTAGMSKYLSD